MRFIIMHKTNAHWEAGAIPTPDLIGRVGGLLGQLAKAGALLAGEGLRPSSEGVRLTFSSGTKSVTNGPFERGNELPAAFSIVRTGSLDEAVEWASRQAQILGDGEVDIRPVTEPWDIGMSPKPKDIPATRFMVLRKATPASEAGEPMPQAQRDDMARLIDASSRSGVHLAKHDMKPSARGR